MLVLVEGIETHLKLDVFGPGVGTYIRVKVLIVRKVIMIFKLAPNRLKISWCDKRLITEQNKRLKRGF